MIVIKKKDVFKELAVSLFLMTEFDDGSSSKGLIKRVRDRALAALKAAVPYTGILGDKEVEEFLEAKSYNFSIDCGTDILQGDIIRFIEAVFDNRYRSPRCLGKRGITAEVMKVIPSDDNNPMLHMRVISCGGVWDLKPEAIIRRQLKNIIHFEVKRAAWEDEVKRELIRTNAFKPQPKIIEKPSTTLGRYDGLRTN